VGIVHVVAVVLGVESRPWKRTLRGSGQAGTAPGARRAIVETRANVVALLAWWQGALKRRTYKW